MPKMTNSRRKRIQLKQRQRKNLVRRLAKIAKRNGRSGSAVG